MDNILVVGAGEYQISGIKKLQELGFFVIAIDGNENCLGSKIADLFIAIDIHNPNLIIETINKRNLKIISAICFATEIALRTVAAINTHFNLKGINNHDVSIATDKAIQRYLLEKNSLPCPKYKELQISSDIYNSIIDFGFPCIIKPTDNAGSRGVSLIQNENGLDDIIKECIKNVNFDSKIIIEEFIPGIEFTVEAFISENSVTILGISEKRKPVNNFTVSIELFYNSPLVEKLRENIEKVITNYLNSCNFSNCITHTEIIYSFNDNKLYVIETTVRSGGFHIFDKILPFITNVDIVKYSIYLNLGTKITLPKIEKNPCILGFYYGNKGTIKKINILDEIKSLSNIEYNLFVKSGDSVSNLDSDGARFGYYISYGDNWESVYNQARMSEYLIKFEIV
ncbi:MAG: Carbamoyl-phosphate synthase large chain [Bacteroidetes bacterium ADurb.Bin217]|nr:MAG: Carbamoyl-phosphate synthase large chain [Bacteroidetes bacterium ADurb.Bin217]